MKVTEIFYSIQGEGLRVGKPTIFVRFHGCSMKCEWCDSKHTWEGEPYKEMSVIEVIGELHKFPCGDVCLTGGEPFEQPELKELCNQLWRNKKIQIETNGSIPFPPGLKYDHITLSPKKGCRKEYYHICTELKFVISRKEDIDNSFNLIKETAAWAPAYLQPVSNDPDMMVECVNAVKLNPRFRLGVQLHKYIGVL